MTAELDEMDPGTPAAGMAERRPAFLTRRTILRGAAIGVPTVLTLQSGAAFAMTSNLISAAAGTPKDANGNYLCLDLRSVAGPGPRPGTYDLGAPAYPDVTGIPSSRTYYLADNSSSATVTGPTMCSNGGTYYYKSSGWQTGNVPRGFLVSATALSSFANTTIKVI